MYFQYQKLALTFLKKIVKISSKLWNVMHFFNIFPIANKQRIRKTFLLPLINSYSINMGQNYVKILFKDFIYLYSQKKLLLSLLNYIYKQKNIREWKNDVDALCLTLFHLFYIFFVFIFFQLVIRSRLLHAGNINNILDMLLKKKNLENILENASRHARSKL